MYQQNDYQQPYGYEPVRSESQLASLVSTTMRKVYVKMFLALIVTAVTAVLCAASPAYQNFLRENGWMMWVLIVAEFGLVIGISGGLNRMSTTVASLLFYLFAIVNGMMLFSIFVVYSPWVIAKTFLITAATFGAMSVYGYLTDRDLSKFGAFLTMALIGIVIAMVVNWFLDSEPLDWVISIIGVFVFLGLTAWDTQQLKAMAAVTPEGYTGKLATIGALNLYLDFINLFLFLLRIFGSRD